MAKVFQKLAFLQDYLDHPEKYLPIVDHAWKCFPDQGNAKRPLLQLAAMAKMRPDGIWKGD